MSGSGYGSHPTIYGPLGDSELYALYRRETWLTLDEQHRQQLLQETVNRAALENGELGSCRVIFEDLEPGVAGRQSGSVIGVSRDMFVRDQRTVTYGDQTIVRPMEASNLEALTTVLHEDQHAYQNQIIRGEVPPPDAALLREYTANDFREISVVGTDGADRSGYTYLQGSTPGEAGYLLYYLQSTERDAHRFSEEKTARIMSELEERWGTEPSFGEYRRDLEVNGFDATMQRAREFFQNENVERDVNQSLMNHYYGTDEPVSPQIESLVSLEMEATYDHIHPSASLDQEQPAEEVSQTDAPSAEIESDGALSEESLDGGLE